MGVATMATVAVDREQALDPLILTLDVGTSSVRAALFDGQARAVTGLEVQKTHQMTSTPDGGVETDADLLFRRLCDTIDNLLALAGPLANRIAAVAPTTFWHNVLGVSDDGSALTPVYTWADTRSRAAVDQLREVLHADTLHARTGCFLHPSYLPAKIRWLQTSGRASGARYWFSLADLLGYRLFSGAPTTSISMASGSGLLNQHTCDWDAETLQAIPLDASQLPAVHDQPRRGLRPAFAARWPALAHLPWYPGWGDGATNNVGSGAVTAGRAAMMVGTSGAMRAVQRVTTFTIAPRLWCYRVDAERIVIGGALSNGGNLLQWLRDTLRFGDSDTPPDLDQLEQGIATIAPDSHGLSVLPFLAGERSPNWAMDARGAILGLRLATRPIEILRAGYEAVAYRFALIFDLLREADPLLRGEDSHPVIASGGALLHSRTWMQMMADVLDTRVAASLVQEASSRGAALLALEALGVLAAVDERTATLGQVYTPEPTATQIYAGAARRQRMLYEVLIAHPPQA